MTTNTAFSDHPIRLLNAQIPMLIEQDAETINRARAYVSRIAESVDDELFLFQALGI